VNLIVIDKQPQLQYFDLDHSLEHCQRGLSILHGAAATSMASQMWCCQPSGISPRSSVVAACVPGDMRLSMDLAAFWSRPIRLIRAGRASPPILAATMNKNGNKQSTASAENTMELFMKSMAFNRDQTFPGMEPLTRSATCRSTSSSPRAC
jgi:hypothetical protein